MRKLSTTTKIFVIVITLVAIWLSFEVLYWGCLEFFRILGSSDNDAALFQGAATDLLKFGEWTLTSHLLVHWIGFWGTIGRFAYVIFILVFDSMVVTIWENIFRRIKCRFNRWIDELSNEMDDESHYPCTR